MYPPPAGMFTKVDTCPPLVATANFCPVFFFPGKKMLLIMKRDSELMMKQFHAQFS
jgi:hypothetical protein